MKLLKKIFVMIIMIVIAIAAFFVKQGYDLYYAAIEEMSIEEKIEEIQSNESYYNYEELPQDYINAVVAVEDKRFFKHPGVDLISISRAIIIDIKEMEFKEGREHNYTATCQKYLFHTREKIYKKNCRNFHGNRFRGKIFKRGNL